MTAPWWYRWRFTNWLLAKPWRWHFCVIYASELEYHLKNRLAFPRLRAAWCALAFPHVHHESED